MFQQPYYSQQQGFSNNHRGSTNFYMPSHPFYYRSNGPIHNQSTHNLNFTHDFERFSTSHPHHGFASMPTGSYPYFDYNNQNFDQQRWRQNMARTQQQHRRTPAFHFQDKSTSYYMTDPIITNDDRITVK
jgi:hypothetical protein